MPSIFNFAILATCAAGGIGAAMALGLSPAPATEAELPLVTAPAEPSITAEEARALEPPPTDPTGPVLTAALEQIRQVVEVQGSSFEQALSAMAERLAISPETVKVHRRHLYAKLDISSQPELFSLFIQALGHDPQNP